MKTAILNVLRKTGEPMATWRVANHLVLGEPRVMASTARVRAELGRMQQKGLVRRHPRYSTVNNIVWELTP